MIWLQNQPATKCVPVPNALMKTLMLIIDNLWTTKKSRDSATLRFRLGRMLLPITLHQASVSLLTWVLRSPRTTNQSPHGGPSSYQPGTPRLCTLSWCLGHREKQQWGPVLLPQGAWKHPLEKTTSKKKYTYPSSLPLTECNSKVE